MRVLKKMLDERRSSTERPKGDFFDRVIDELQKDGTMMTEAIALDLMFVMLFTSYETTSLALTMAVKLITEHPHVLERLTVGNLCLSVLFLLYLPSCIEMKKCYISELSYVITRRSMRKF